MQSYIIFAIKNFLSPSNLSFMKLKFFCPLWGSNSLEFNQFCLKAKEAGYDGVELSFPLEEDKKRAMVDAIQNHGLEIIAQHFETTDADFDNHKENYRTRIENLSTVTPLFINSQTGKDFFSFDQNHELIGIAKDIEQKTGVKVLHETHRGKFSFAAHITKQFIQCIPDLRMTFDLSHWCNVAETMLEDQAEAVDLAIERADHIHARVGFAEGPQIPDPRSKEWESTVKKFITWWQRIITRAIQEGKNEFTITSEFGPFPYMTIQPFTTMPITNQWAVNVYMMELLKRELT